MDRRRLRRGVFSALGFSAALGRLATGRVLWHLFAELVVACYELIEFREPLFQGEVGDATDHDGAGKPVHGVAATEIEEAVTLAQALVATTSAESVVNPIAGEAAGWVVFHESFHKRQKVLRVSGACP